jgi:hypothetical protein
MQFFKPSYVVTRNQYGPARVEDDVCVVQVGPRDTAGHDGPFRNLACELIRERDSRARRQEESYRCDAQGDRFPVHTLCTYG